MKMIKIAASVAALSLCLAGFALASDGTGNQSIIVQYGDANVALHIQNDNGAGAGNYAATFQGDVTGDVASNNHFSLIEQKADAGSLNVAIAVQNDATEAALVNPGTDAGTLAAYADLSMVPIPVLP